jgi:hypothetical protein
MDLPTYPVLSTKPTSSLTYEIQYGRLERGTASQVSRGEVSTSHRTVCTGSLVLTD